MDCFPTDDNQYPGKNHKTYIYLSKMIPRTGTPFLPTHHFSEISARKSYKKCDDSYKSKFKNLATNQFQFNLL